MLDGVWLPANDELRLPYSFMKPFHRKVNYAWLCVTNQIIALPTTNYIGFHLTATLYSPYPGGWEVDWSRHRLMLFFNLHTFAVHEANINGDVIEWNPPLFVYGASFVATNFTLSLTWCYVHATMEGIALRKMIRTRWASKTRRKPSPQKKAKNGIRRKMTFFFFIRHVTYSIFRRGFSFFCYR